MVKFIPFDELDIDMDVLARGSHGYSIPLHKRRDLRTHFREMRLTQIIEQAASRDLNIDEIRELDLLFGTEGDIFSILDAIQGVKEGKDSPRDLISNSDPDIKVMTVEYLRKFVPHGQISRSPEVIESAITAITKIIEQDRKSGLSELEPESGSEARHRRSKAEHVRREYAQAPYQLTVEGELFRFGKPILPPVSGLGYRIYPVLEDGEHGFTNLKQALLAREVIQDLYSQHKNETLKWSDQWILGQPR